MRKITQQEFDTFPVVDGFKICPSGDYREINNFKERCSFGDRVDRLKCLGNAVVPQVAQKIGEMILKGELQNAA